MVCPNCGEKIDIHSRNCKFCGTFIAKTHELSSRSKTISNVFPTMDTEEIKICPECSEVNKSHAVLCQYCQANLSHIDIVEKDSSYIIKSAVKDIRKDKTRKIINWSLSILLLCLYVFALIYGTSHSTSTDFMQLYFGAVITGSFGLLNLFVPELFFYLKHGLWIDNAEPSDFYLSYARFGGYIFVVVSIGVLILSIL
ncbi:zinc ribbon domain-containing protein [Vallitalea okinawensis]|uniref:zinc ribbon domain-containing protein n=1 Tax=Vallitalea okinawensis TaxID=2078660 RepID=UPI000CFC0929|nr:zinc ribbon domain-containing protein [Vallitalea okinawensis]